MSEVSSMEWLASTALIESPPTPPEPGGHAAVADRGVEAEENPAGGASEYAALGMDMCVFFYVMGGVCDQIHVSKFNVLVRQCTNASDLGWSGNHHPLFTVIQ